MFSFSFPFQTHHHLSGRVMQKKKKKRHKETQLGFFQKNLKNALQTF